MSTQSEQSREAHAIQAAQEDEYIFPYHYVTRIPPNGFRQHFVDSWGINYSATIDFVLDRIMAASPESLLDIGCGDGRFTREIYSRAKVPSVCGIDTSHRAICLAKAMNQDLPAIKFVSGDISSENAIGQFDTAILMEVLEHIPPHSLPTFMKSVRTLVKPRGRLHVTVPHTNKPVEYKHFQHFTFSSIAACLNADFEIITIMPFERRGLRRELLNSLLCNRFFVLNNQRLLDILYRWHKRSLFACTTESDCQRIYVEAVAR